MFEQRFRIIGAKILCYRKIKGWTQSELSQRAHISPSYLSRIESGKYQGVSMLALLGIADSLGVDVVKLVISE